MSIEEKMEADGRSIYVGNVSYRLIVVIDAILALVLFPVATFQTMSRKIDQIS